MPEISAPNGNGVAFEKFMVLYNELAGGEPPTEPLGVDTLT